MGTGKAALSKDTAGQIAAQAGLTVDVNRLSRVQLPQPLPQLIHRDVKGAFQTAVGDLRVGPHIQQGHATVSRQGSNVMPVELPYLPLGQVFDQVADEIHRVLGRGIGRRIGQVQLLELRRRHPGSDGSGQNVDTLVHPFPPHDLRPQQAQGALLIQRLDVQRRGTGIIGRMGRRKEHYLVIVQSFGLGRFLVDARRGRRHIKEL